MVDEAPESTGSELPDPLYQASAFSSNRLGNLLNFLATHDATSTFHLRNVVVLYDQNPEHHATNLIRGITRSGGRSGGCNWCYQRLLSHFFSNSQQELTDWWWEEGRTDDQRRERLEEVKQDHADAINNTTTPLPLGTMTDMSTFQNRGQNLHRELDAIDNVLNPGAMRESMDEVASFITSVGRLFGPINVIASVHHGFTNKIHLGGELTNGQIDSFIDRIQEFLADDIRWVFFACSTAGDDQQPYQPATSPFAQRFQQSLTRTKSQAEVWGHLGPGDTLERPYLVRFKVGTAVSLFDHCLQGAERIGDAYNLFKPLLRRAFQDMGYGENDFPSPEDAIHFIPLWPVDFEQTSLQRRCLEAWRQRLERR
ncbi:MAG: hypothetical protein KG012_12625 [Deltaproteobacteria bacterium]|nr:hypothetical protein [Deltaproteobacteria bacterium]